jgi:hypothetical protein
MHRRFRHAVALSVLAAALASCALLNSLVPPIDDPLGLDGTEVPLEKQATVVPAALAPQQGVSTFTGSFTSTLPDLSDPPAEPRSLRTELGFDPIVLGSALAIDAESFPDAFVVESIAVDVTLRDGDASVSLAFATSGLDVRFEREGSCSVDAVASCRYLPASAAIEGLSIRIAGEDFRALFDLLTSGASSNEVEGTLTIGIAPAVGADVHAAVVTLRTTPGRIDVF